MAITRLPCFTLLGPSSWLAFITLAQALSTPLYELQFNNNLVDSSPSHHQNIMYSGGSPFYEAGVNGDAVRLVSPDLANAEWISFGNPADLNFGSSKDFSISFWLKTPGADSQEPSIISQKNWQSGSNTGYSIFIASDFIGWNYRTENEPRLDVHIPSGTDDLWHHWVFSHARNDAAYFYTDGVLQTKQDLSGRNGTIDAGYPTNIGLDGAGHLWGTRFNATLDNFQIYDSALSADDVKNIVCKDMPFAKVCAVEPPVTTTTPLYEFLFDGNVKDSSPSHHANVQFNGGTPSFVSGISSESSAIHLNTTMLSTAQWIDLGKPADLMFGASQDFTVSFWLRTPGADSNEPAIISNKNWASGANIGWSIFVGTTFLGWNWETQGDSRLDVHLSGATDNTWHHWVFSHKRNDSAYFYVDGYLANEVSFSGRSGSVDAGFDTNVGLDGAGNLFGSKLDIMLDNLRIYNQSLSEADVLDIVCGDLPSAPICSGTGSGGNGTEFKPDGFGGKIDTLVFFMQENRAFDTYFGTMAGVRNFADPDLPPNSSILYQSDPSSSDMINGRPYLLPFHLSGTKAQCTPGGTNDWTGSHNAWNQGKNDNWVVGNSPHALGYFARSEVEYYFALAEAYTVADMYFTSIMGPTCPNREMLMTASIDAEGKFQGPMEDNSEPGLTWQTYPEVLQAAGVNWKIWQDPDNFDDNALAWFKQYQNLLPSSPLYQRGMQAVGIQTFLKDAMEGTLPQVNYVVAPYELSEHPDNLPVSGAWLTQQIINALQASPKWNTTAFFLSYDETGGFYDHVTPPTAPPGTKGEWAVDQWTKQEVPIGLGYRTPFIVVSPYTRGGNVFTEVSDHTSQIKLIETWAGRDGNGTSVAQCSLLTDWRRTLVSDLSGVFDFSNPDLSIPTLPTVPMPSGGGFDRWNSTETCEKLPGSKPTMPYGHQTLPVVEMGYKKVRGHATIGRTYVFEPRKAQGALDTVGGLTLGAVSKSHNISSQFFILREAKGGFKIQSGATGNCIHVQLTLDDCANATSWQVNDLRNGQGHVIVDVNQNYLSVSQSSVNIRRGQQIAKAKITVSKVKFVWDIYSVTY